MNQVETMASVQILRAGDYEMTRDDFARVRTLIYDHAGISLSDAKVDMVYSRLVRRIRATGENSFKNYLDFLQSAAGAGEWQSFVNSLTTNLTAFFREPHHFEILAKHLRTLPTDKPLNIWCSASSTGEEPYSIAMTVVETFNRWDAPVRILASDLDTNVLDTAQAGVYSDERVRGLSAERIRRFFLKGAGQQEGKVRVRPELQKMITFKQLNLLAPSWPMQGPFDEVFCRNVMIYFDKPTQLKVLEKMVRLMSPHAYFFAGHSESFHNAGHLIRLREKTVYEIVAPSGKGVRT